MAENKLHGLRILVTRAEDQADSFATQLRAEGATAIERAVLAVGPAADYSDLDRALKQLDQYQWIIFASQNAVAFTLQRLAEIGLGRQSDNSRNSTAINPPNSCTDSPPNSTAHKPQNSTTHSPFKHCQIASIGSATSECLSKAGIEVAFQPSVYVAENFVAEFLACKNLAGERVLWPKTNIGRPFIAEQLTAAGAIVETAIAYESGLPANPAQLGNELVLLLKAKAIDVITLASAQTARNLSELLELGLQQELGLKQELELVPEKTANYSKEKVAHLKEELLASVKIAAIGPITAAVAKECLGRVDIVAPEHTLKGLTEALLASLKFEQNH
ncbi:hypothetical protein BH11CYA1_BH11CYA1_03750 [soil metagenome]